MNKVLALLALAVLPLAAHALPSEIRAEYQLTNHGIPIGRVTESFVRKGDDYAIQSVTRSEGVLKLVLDDELTVASKGKVVREGLRPLQFDQKRARDARRDVSATFDWERGVMRSSYRGEKIEVPLPRHTQDRLSLMYQFMNLAPREGDVVVPMSNGRKVEHYTYRLVEEVRLNTPAGEFETLHYARVTDGAKDAKADVWLAKDRFNFPVRVVFDDRGMRLEQTLVAFQAR